MIRHLCTLAFILLIATGCSKEDSEPPAQERPAPIVRVEAPATAQVGETVTVDVHFQVSGGCGQFGSFNVSSSGKETVIRVVAKYQGNVCTDDLPIRTAPYTFRPTEAGIYTLKFRSTPQVGFIVATIDVGDF
ncbi:hypothetical protein [Pontibacter lucknowensis]|uniref:Uncharacterized protein n=1 Tax=Pontibacter lucknowensis TaxID=1077936 RepID=A0A1N6T343_9BACT|nr:hypothetical protein [Pontibacter lucknowensis]SIQ47750.1 hypothetical protein SAMN05421545_0096 [Pontibacter lucknowensis]